MCFGVRFSLYLASYLPDFDLFFLCVWFLGGGNNVGTIKRGGDQPKKREGTGLVPLFPPPPGSAYGLLHYIKAIITGTLIVPMA